MLQVHSVTFGAKMVSLFLSAPKVAIVLKDYVQLKPINSNGKINFFPQICPNSHILTKHKKKHKLQYAIF